MIYERHNFKQNLQSALSFGDKDAVYDVVLNEIADKYKSNKQGIVSAIRKSGVKISDNPTNKKVATVIVENINDKQFANNIFSAFKREPYSSADASFIAGAAVGITVMALSKMVRDKEQQKSDIESFTKQLDSKVGVTGSGKPLLVGATIIGSMLLIAYLVTKKSS